MCMVDICVVSSFYNLNTAHADRSEVSMVYKAVRELF